MVAALPAMPAAMRGYGRPESVDVDWHRTENQGRMGSCQGFDLTSCLERLHFVRTRETVALSEIFAYLGSQRIDGISGDRGSTISGGVKLALQYGVPLEELTGYPSNYPGRGQRARILSEDNYAAGAPYKALSSWRVDEDLDAALDWIGGGGAISIGVAYWSGMIPRDRIVRQFRPPRRYGGHAMAVLGYTREGHLVAVNSHGDGRYEITPEAWAQMLRHRYTVMIGLAGASEPAPVDWISDSIFA